VTILLFSFLKIWYRRGCCERRLLFEEERNEMQNQISRISPPSKIKIVLGLIKILLVLGRIKRD